MDKVLIRALLCGEMLVIFERILVPEQTDRANC